MKPLISLDVFDTALFRKVFYPTDIFNIIEDEVGRNFKSLRIDAQNKAARKNPFYNILDIYKEFSIGFNPKEEIKAEYANCYANPYILDMYNKGEADFIFISDMYLPSSVIKSMLEKCGYKNPRVFVSCDMGASKGAGKLFLEVEKVLKRKIDKHIGDNYQADIIGAQKAGISKTEFVGPPIYNKGVVTPVLKNVKLRKLLIDEELSGAPIEEKIGYQFAPLVLAFTQYILNEATESQTVFFNARDSFVMYIVARWLLKTKKKIKYCRFSRKSCHLANINTNYRIDHKNNDKALSFFRTLRINNIGELIETFGFCGDYSGILEQLKIDKGTQLEYPLQKNRVIQKFLISAQKELYAKALENRKNLKVYVDRLKLKNNDIFVDLGHAGSMQSILESVLKIKLNGRYVHTFQNYQGNRKLSFLPIGILGIYTGIAEVVFSEPKGTSVGYTSDGKVILSKDVKFRTMVTKCILKGTIKGVRDIIDNKVNVCYDDLLIILKRFFAHPTLEEAKFGNANIFENGSYDNNESIVWFNKDLIKKGKIRECYIRSYWKPAFKLLLNNDPEFKSLAKEIK